LVPSVTKNTSRKIDPEALIASALAIADQEGLESLTIRRLAQQHEVTPMALYRHFRDKDQLLHAIAAEVLRQVEVPAPGGGPWYDELRALFQAILTALRPHPNLAALTFRRFLTSEPGLELSERALLLLAESGISVDQAAQFGVQAVCSLVNLVATEPGMDDLNLAPEEQEDVIRAKRARLTALSPRRFPHVIAAADALTCVFDRDAYYEHGLELIVAGLREVARG
jgi:TetR/AcrR family transcriptional regulator, tetracycline repressor protein